MVTHNVSDLTAHYNLFKALPKEQELDWPSHIPSLVSAYNVMMQIVRAISHMSLCLDTRHQPFVMPGMGSPTIMIDTKK